MLWEKKLEDEFYFFSINCFHLIQHIYFNKYIFQNLFSNFYLFIYLFLAMLGLCCCKGFPLVVVSGRYSLVAVRGLLIVVASLVEEYGLCGMWASVVAACGLSGAASGL